MQRAAGAASAVSSGGAASLRLAGASAHAPRQAAHRQALPAVRPPSRLATTGAGSAMAPAAGRAMRPALTPRCQERSSRLGVLGSAGTARPRRCVSRAATSRPWRLRPRSAGARACQRPTQGTPRRRTAHATASSQPAPHAGGAGFSSCRSAACVRRLASSATWSVTALPRPVCEQQRVVGQDVDAARQALRRAEHGSRAVAGQQADRSRRRAAGDSRE